MNEFDIRKNQFYLSGNDKSLQNLLTCPVPDNEDDRLCVLRQSNLLDSDSSDPEFDRYTSLASRIFGLPIALVSLIDADRQWFKSKVGLDAPQTHRNHAFCSYTVLPMTSEVFVVADSDNDPRFCNNPLVTGPPFVKFYAGAALIVDGVKVGSLCVIDNHPRFDFTLEKQMTLLNIGSMVSAVIKRRRDVALNQKNKYSKHLLNIMSELRIPMKQTIDTAQIIENSSPRNDISKELQNNFNIIKSIINELGFKLELSINLYPIILNKPLFDDKIQDCNENSDINSQMSGYSSSDTDNPQLGIFKDCNIITIISKAQEILKILPYSKNIEWMIDKTYLGLGSHLCYPEVVLHTLLHQTNKLLKKYEKLSIFVGFKKDMNSALKTIFDESILSGKLSIEFRCSGYDICPIFPPNSINYISMMDQTTQAIDTYYNITNILSDIKGYYQEIKMVKQEDLSKESNCIQNDILKSLSEKNHHNNHNKENIKRTISDESLEKIFSYRIPCRINNINLTSTTKILIISDDFQNNVIFCEWLRDLGFTVKLAKTADEGLSILKNVSYDILFVKITMVEKSGGTVLQEFNVWKQINKSSGLNNCNQDIFIIGMSKLKLDNDIQFILKNSNRDFSPLNKSDTNTKTNSTIQSRRNSGVHSPVDPNSPLINIKFASKDDNDCTTSSDRASAIGYGMQAYFSNPFNARQMLLHVLNECNNSKDIHNSFQLDKKDDISKLYENYKAFTESKVIQKELLKSTAIDLLNGF